MKTKVRIFTDGDDPLTEEYIEVDVPKGVKIMSNEPYVAELLELYENSGMHGYDIPENGAIMEGEVINKSESQIELNINGKQSAFVPLKKDEKKYADSYGVGDSVKFRIEVKENNDNTEYVGSFSDVVEIEKTREIIESIGQPVAYMATVLELVNGGYFLDIDGIRVFMPGSLAGMNKLWDFESLIGKDLTVMPINYSNDKNTIVVSHREYLHTLLPGTVRKAKENLGQEYTGFVTGTTKFGVFAEFETCMTGLIMNSELSDEWKKKFEAREIKPGDEISFFIKDIINDKKIMLTQTPDTSWDNLDEKYPPSSKVTGKVIKLRNYGAFVELEPGVVGLLHISEFEKGTINEEEEIEVIVNKIDIGNKKIVLKGT